MLPIFIESAASTSRNVFWTESLARFTYVRDFACVFLLWHALHVGINVRASSPSIDCPYFGAPSLLLMGASMMIYLASLLQRSAGAWATVADVAGVGVGVYLQIASKPSTWALSIGTPECSLAEAPYGEFVFFAGELMTFPLMLRLVFYAFSRVSGLAGRALVVLGLLVGSVGTGFATDAIVRAVA